MPPNRLTEPEHPAPSRFSRSLANARSAEISLVIAAVCLIVVAAVTREPAFVLLSIFPALASLGCRR